MKKNESGLYECDVDGRNYEFEKWGAEESLDVLLDISSVVGGAIGTAIGNTISGQGLNTEIDAAMLSVVFEQLSKNLKKEVVKPILVKLTSGRVLCEGKKVNFNEHYKEDLFHMFRVAKAALEVQYGNFFGAIQGVVAPKRPVGVTNRAL